jgi:hypothetical protein
MVDQLLPGDVLLHVGATWESDGIRFGEWEQLGANPNGAPTYSHAGIYVGGGETVEMLSVWTQQPVVASVVADTHVDVYRNPVLSSAQRQAIADKAKEYGRDGGPPYAWGQIKALVLAGLGDPATIERSFVAEVDETDAGKEAMICSELVAWAYYDSGVALTFQFWPAIVSDGLLSMPTPNQTLARLMDYTTPNMLARTRDLQFQFRLWPPAPTDVKPINGSCPAGYARCQQVCRQASLHCP